MLPFLISFFVRNSSLHSKTESDEGVQMKTVSEQRGTERMQHWRENRRPVAEEVEPERSRGDSAPGHHVSSKWGI